MTERHNEDEFIISATDSREEIVRAALPVCCSLANADGGKIILDGVAQSSSSIQEIQEFIEQSFSDKNKISTNPLREIVLASRRGEEFLVLDIAPATWLERPIFLNSDPSKGTFRYYEGEHFASGKNLLLRMARDSTNFQMDNERLASPIKIDHDALSRYRALLRTLRPFPKWDMLDEKKFLERVGAFDGDEMTLGGAMMFGAGTRGHFFLNLPNEKEIRAHNILNFIETALPKILSFSEGIDERASALKEAFFNSLIHADYSAGGVEISFDGERVIFKNSGIPRAKERNFAVCRNPRIMKMLRLVGFASDRGLGMETIKTFFGDAELVVNLENWETTLALQVAEARTEEAAIVEEKLDFYPVVRLKITEEPEQTEEPEETDKIEGIIEEEPEEIEEIPDEIQEISEPVPDLLHVVISVPEEEPEIETEPEPEPELPQEELPTLDVVGEYRMMLAAQSEYANTDAPLEEQEEEQEYEHEDEPEEAPVPLPAPVLVEHEYHNLGLKPLHLVMGTLVEEEEDEPEIAEETPKEIVPREPEFFDTESLPVIVQMVRRNPRTPAVVVREALLDYCRGTFRSLPEISQALLRSEASIKRRYVKPLLTEKALEMNEHDAYRSVA